MSIPIQPNYAAVLVLTISISASWTAAAGGESRPNWWNPDDATAGMRMVVREESRMEKDPNWGGHKSVTARFSASGFPKNKRYELWGTWLDLRTAKFMTLVVDRKGDLRMIDPRSGALGAEFGKISLVLGNYAKGEPAAFALVSTDRKAKAFAKLIPFPLEARDHGCRLWMEIVTSDGTTFLVRGDGFEPGEEVATLSKSNGERLPGEQKISSDGKYGPILVLPATVGGKHKASYTVTGRSCSVNINYKWGASALKKE